MAYKADALVFLKYVYASFLDTGSSFIIALLGFSRNEQRARHRLEPTLADGSDQSLIARRL
jgi:hypothetical protein